MNRSKHYWRLCDGQDQSAHSQAPTSDHPSRASLDRITGLLGGDYLRGGAGIAAMDKVDLHTRIVTKVTEAANKLDKAGCDKERICYLVTDEEWRQLIRYAGQFNFDSCSLPGVEAKTMQFAGIEIIKRSSLV